MFIFYLIGLFVVLCIRNKFAIKYPNNPPSLLWTLIFGLLYLLWYWSWIDENGSTHLSQEDAKFVKTALANKDAKMSKGEKMALASLLFITFITLAVAYSFN